LETKTGGLNKYGKLILILVGLAIVIWLAAISLAVLIPFIVGILLAYLLMPLVRWLEKVLPPRRRARKWKRAAAVAIVFIVFSIVLALFLAYLGAALFTATGILVEKAPDFISKSAGQAQEWWKGLRIHLPADINSRVDTTLENLGPQAGKFVQDFLMGTLAVLGSTMPTIIGFITLPFFLIFVLIDYEKFGRYYGDIFPFAAAHHTTKILRIFGDQMGRYIRYQIILSLIVGFLVTVGLLVLGEDYAPAMGVIAAAAQVIPIIGPFISAAAILIITFALKPSVIFWAAVIIVVAQVVVNLMQGWLQMKHFPLHPAVVMVLLTVGGYVASYWGMILALPVGATVWEIYRYFKNEHEVKAGRPDRADIV
jgi:predicted PurR-regulated permease PerM